MVTAIKQYRCNKIYANKSRAESIVDTVEFPLEHNKIPEVSNQEAATNTELYSIEDITNPAPSAPFSSMGDRKLQVIRKLVYIFKQKTTPQEAHQKESAQTRVEVKHYIPSNNTTSSRVKLPSNLKITATTSSKNSKPDRPIPIVAYDKDKYTTLRVVAEPIYGEHYLTIHDIKNGCRIYTIK